MVFSLSSINHTPWNNATLGFHFHHFKRHLNLWLNSHHFKAWGILLQRGSRVSNPSVPPSSFFLLFDQERLPPPKRANTNEARLAALPYLPRLMFPSFYFLQQAWLPLYGNKWFSKSSVNAKLFCKAKIPQGQLWLQETERVFKKEFRAHCGHQHGEKPSLTGTRASQNKEGV